MKNIVPYFVRIYLLIVLFLYTYSTEVNERAIYSQYAIIIFYIGICMYLFYSLIKKVGDAKLFPIEALDMVHTIRKHRNEVVHHQKSKSDTRVFGKKLLCLLAFSLLWPYLVESDLQKPSGS